MAQHDMNIANQGFPATRADLNNALQALVSNSSGATAPSTTFANQWWYDTTNNKMYLRNEANNAWIEVAVLDQTNNEWQITTGVIQAKDSDGLALKTDDGTTRLFIKDSDGSIGIGTASPNTKAHIVGLNQTNGTMQLQPDSAKGSNDSFVHYGTNGDWYIRSASTSGDIHIQDTGGNVNIGTTSSANSAKLTVLSGKINAGTASSVGGSVILEGYYTNGSLSNWGTVSSSGGAAMLYAAHPKTGAQTTFTSSTGINIVRSAYVSEGEHKWYTGAAQTVAIGSDLSMSERMRLDNDGHFLHGKQSSNVLSAGVELRASGLSPIITTTADDQVCIFNRQNNDGNILSFRQAGTVEGTISVSGTTVSYNGGHLSRWSQLTDNSKDTSILKGTVMTNLDQMAVWSHDAVAAQDAVYEDVIHPAVEEVLDDDGNVITEAQPEQTYQRIVTEAVEAKDAYTEENEQLNCMAVSSLEGDPNVAGVFVNWDNTDDGFNDMNVAMTGDMVIRIAQGTTVARGDLLMSAGDGTAKPQDDDIVRSKTIAKVTSTNISHTYDDGSYLVPCVLMAC